MVSIVSTVAYLGLEARSVEVQCQIAPGMVGFAVVGLPDKAVAESRERVRAAISSLGLALPPKRITINLSPADLPKEGSHYDLPIALALLAAMGLVDAETLAHYLVVGELGLDGKVAGSPGVLLAALHASSRGMGLICPSAQGPEAAWAGQIEVVAAPDLLALLNHLKGQTHLRPPEPGIVQEPVAGPDLKMVKGQETAKRALEIAAAGGHNLCMTGPPGAGKSLLASCLPGILPDLTPAEAIRGLDDIIRCRQSGRRTLGAAPALSKPAPQRIDARSGRRRCARSAGRSQSRPFGGAFSGRASRVSACRSRQSSPAPRNRGSQRRPRQQPCYLSGELPACRRHEPLSMRTSGRCGTRLQPRTTLRSGLSGENFGTAAGPHRFACRSASRQRSRSRTASAR